MDQSAIAKLARNHVKKLLSMHDEEQRIPTSLADSVKVRPLNWEILK